jgi:aquaporin Z
MVRKLVVEGIGTFFLVFTIGLVVTANPPVSVAPLAIGSLLMVMVYAGGHISGAHYNPAVSLAIFLRGKATGAELIGYWIAQFIGGAAGGALARFMGELPSAGPPPDFLFGGIAELIFTFALAYVVLNVATTRGTEGNSYYGLAIGFTVMVGAFTVGPISGAVFNPAVAVGITIRGISELGALPMFFVAQFAGAAAAALLFKALDLGDDKPTTATHAQQRDLKQAGEPGR